MPRAFFLSAAEIYEQKLREEEAAKKRTRRSFGVKSAPAVYNCETCGLLRKCRSPEMKRFGKGKKDILLVGEAPGGDEDRQGRPFVGESGQFLKKVLKAFDIDMDKDCTRTNVIRCRPPKNRDPKPHEKRACYSKLVKDIEEVQPKLIICLGDPAVRGVMKGAKVIGNLGTSIMTKVHAAVFPYHKYKAWVGCSYHPAAAGYNSRYEDVFIEDMSTILSFLDKPLPQPLTDEGNILVDDSSDVQDLLKAFIAKGAPTAFDYETNCFSAYAEDARILTVSLSNRVDEGWCIWLNNPKWNEIERTFVYRQFREFLMSDVPKVVQNYNMEELWSREHVDTPINNMVMDTMVATHVVNCRRGTTSLDHQVFRMTGHYYSNMVNASKMADEPIEKVSSYNCLDSRYTLMLFQQLSEILHRKGNEDLLRFNNFLHSCMPVLADLKERGMPVDTNVLEEFKETSKVQIADYQKQLMETVAGQKFKERYKEDINIESPKDMKELFYDIYDEKVYRRTAKKEISVDASCLQKMNQYSRSRDVREVTEIILAHKKVISFLKRIKEYEGVTDADGRLHPSYNLNVAETFRSSTTGPNVQNMFKRDEELIKFRKIIIPSPGNILLEVDVDGIEFRTWAMVSGDKELAKQIATFDKFRIENPDEPNPWDPHSRWAAKLYEKDYRDVDKEERFIGKNSFVFATIYGALPESIAKSADLAFDVVEGVWNEFWEEYGEAKAWREKVLADYKQNLYVSCATGFRRPGPLTDEQLYNTPVQGPAFHLVLASLSKINTILYENRFKTEPNNEIHDSIVFDASPPEVEDVIEIATKALCEKKFEWQGDVPLSVSWEIGKNFYGMVPI